jgi:hypothetical protein
VPLAAGYLKLLARRRGLEPACEIEILPAAVANDWADEGIVEAVLQRRPDLVGLTCYLWNIDRSLWIAGRIKSRRPEVKIVLGGPEITADNQWVLRHAAVDFAVFGEGEQTFVELLRSMPAKARLPEPIPGLWSRSRPETPPVRKPLADLNEVSSPYLAGILDAADERMMMLETVRGCAFKCKFCYYPKSYDALYFISPEQIVANLRHAARRGAREIVLLDPTLNQRRDFAAFLRLLAEHNLDRQFTFFGELRGEGIRKETARLLREAGFSEVEIGLQSLDARTQALMDRKVNLKAFERGARAMLDEGIQVRVDLILGLPGDTPESFRRSVEYLRHSKLCTAVQVFNLSILPGTEFRREAAALGLQHQAQPPYYVLETPAMGLGTMVELMEEAQDAFDLEFDPFPPPVLEFAEDAAGPVRCARIDLDAGPGDLPPPARRAQAFTLWLRSAEFDARRGAAAELVRRCVDDNPHTTLQVVLEPTAAPERLTRPTLDAVQDACYPGTSYLDRFYSLHPNDLLRAKRLIVAVPAKDRERLTPEWTDEVESYATVVWRSAE